MDTVRGGFYVNRGELDFRSKFGHESSGDEEASSSSSPVKKKADKARFFIFKLFDLKH